MGEIKPLKAIPSHDTKILAPKPHLSLFTSDFTCNLQLNNTLEKGGPKFWHVERYSLIVRLYVCLCITVFKKAWTYAWPLELHGSL